MIFSIFISLVVIFVCSLGFYVCILTKKKIPDMLFSTDESRQPSLDPVSQCVPDDSKIVVIQNNDFKDEKQRLNYDGLKDCVLFKKIYGNLNFYGTSCLGFGNCISVCPQNAISLKNGVAFIGTSCNSCKLCLSVCPENVIRLVAQKKIEKNCE